MDDFQVTCIVTAHEGDLEASAQLYILASNFLVYESLALVVPDGTKRFPARFHPGAHLGGLALACIPTSEEREAPWQLEADGSLSVDASRKSKTGLTNLTLPWLSSAPGGLCQVCDARRELRATPEPKQRARGPRSTNPLFGSLRSQVEDCQLFSAYVKITNCSAEHTCMNLTGSKPVWLYSGLFCPIAFERAVGSSAGWVFRKSVATPQDVFYLAPETSDAAKCDGGLLLIRSNRTWDFENTSSKYIELFGEHVACLTADVPHGVVQATFDKGRQDLKIKNEQTFIGKGLQLTLKPQACQAPVLSPEMSEALMVDDPSTTTDMDYTLHACDCFPESWTGDPVTPKSAGQLPPGSDNEYVPLAIEIAKGSLVCDQESLLAPPYMLDGARQEECHHACQLNTSCRFFWMGSAAAVSQCRLYTACRTLLTEAGASGTLAARSSDKVCRRADPEKCWASFRRAFLFAGTSKSGPSDCAHQALLEQCDVNLMMGGEGVEDCSRCVYASLGSGRRRRWQQKRQLSGNFASGSQLEISCWSERYAAVTPWKAGTQSKSYRLSCSGGKWWGPHGEPGFSGFACAPCVQVVQPDYVGYQDKGEQELFFLPNLHLNIGFDALIPMVVSSKGDLVDGSLKEGPRKESAALPEEDSSLLQWRAPPESRGASPQGATGVWRVRHNLFSDRTFQLSTGLSNSKCLEGSALEFDTSVCQTSFVAKQQFQHPSVLSTLEQAVQTKFLRKSQVSPKQDPKQDGSDTLLRSSFTRDCGSFALANLSFHEAPEFTGCGLASAAAMPTASRLFHVVPSVRFLQPNTGRCFNVEDLSRLNEPYNFDFAPCVDGYSDFFWNGSQLVLLADPTLCFGMGRGTPAVPVSCHLGLNIRAYPVQA